MTGELGYIADEVARATVTAARLHEVVHDLAGAIDAGDRMLTAIYVAALCLGTTALTEDLDAVAVDVETARKTITDALTNGGTA